MAREKDDVGDQEKSGFSVSYVGVELVVSAILTFVGLAVIIDSVRIGAGWSGGNLQSGYFPLRLGVLISAVSVIIFFRALINRVKIVEKFVTHTEVGRVMAVLVPTVLYVVGIQLIGIYVSSTIFIGAFMRFAGKQGWGKTICISVATSAALFVLFEVIFLIPLPKGPFEALFGY